MIDDLEGLRAALNTGLIEREEEIDAIMLGLLSREHVLLVGPPGCGKSLLCNRVAKVLGASAFRVLLTKFTTPDEVFGPVRLSALKVDRFERALDGYAATAEISFIDELFKASSAILNAMLTLLEERKFDNGGSAIDCPLKMCIGASNEWPNLDEARELGALFDRFAIRRVVQPVSSDGRDALLFGPDTGMESEERCDSSFYALAVMHATTPSVTSDARDTLLQIVQELASNGIRPGDRRLVKAVKIAKASAFMDGSADVKPNHLACLTQVLWDDPAQADKAGEVIRRIADPVGNEINNLLKELVDITSTKAADKAAKMANVTKLQDVLDRSQKLAVYGNGRAAKLVGKVQSELMTLQAEMLGVSAEKMRRLQSVK